MKPYKLWKDLDAALDCDSIGKKYQVPYVITCTSLWKDAGKFLKAGDYENAREHLEYIIKAHYKYSNTPSYVDPNPFGDKVQTILNGFAKSAANLLAFAL